MNYWLLATILLTSCTLSVVEESQESQPDSLETSDRPDLPSPGSWVESAGAGPTGCESLYKKLIVGSTEVWVEVPVECRHEREPLPDTDPFQVNMSEEQIRY